MVCKLPPRPCCAPDPLKLLYLPPELRRSVYEQILELAQPYEDEDKVSLDIARFNFFGLPSEIRLCIYECLLKPATVDICSYDLSEDDDDDEEEAKEVTATVSSETNIPLYAQRIGPKYLTPAVLRTCKAVYAEAQTLLYRPYALTLRPAFAYLAKPVDYGEDNSDIKLTGHGSRNFEPARLGCIQQLSKMQIELFTTSTTKEEDIAHSAALIKSFRGKIKVGLLELRIFNRFFGARDKHEPHFEIEKETTFELITRWSNVLAPKRLKVLIGDKPGIVMKFHEDENGIWSKKELVHISGELLSG